MAKIIVIFTIVFVFYCEMNAELYYLQNKGTATADIQNPLETEKDSEDIKRLQRRAGLQTLTKRYTNGSREDNNYLSEFVQSDIEAYINTFFKPGVVNSRRFNKPGVVNRSTFNKIYNIEESTETDELGSKSTKLKKRTKYHHDSRKNMTKKHDSANSEGKETHKKDEQDMTENDNSSGSTIIILSREKLHTQKKRFKIKDREDQKTSKHPKDTRINHEREKDKKTHDKEKRKGKKEEKKMDDGESSKNDTINNTKQLKLKRNHTQNEPSKNNKSEDVLRFTKSNSARYKATIKVTKPLPRKISVKEPTTTKTTEHNPTPTEKMLKKKRKGQRQPLLRANRPYSETGKHMRSCKLYFSGMFNDSVRS